MKKIVFLLFFFSLISLINLYQTDQISAIWVETFSIASLVFLISKDPLFRIKRFSFFLLLLVGFTILNLEAFPIKEFIPFLIWKAVIFILAGIAAMNVSLGKKNN